jgi:hypothetical protein
VLTPFSTLQLICSYKVGCDLPGKYRVALDSDALVFGGHGRVSSDDIYWKDVFFPTPVVGAMRIVSGCRVCKIHRCCDTGWPRCGSLHIA